MNKNLKSNNDKSAGENSIVFRLFSVINGLVPKILAQQVTNLVNKFALLLHKYRFSKDCRNRLYVMSGDDKYEGRLFMFFPFLKLLNRIYHPGSSANELTLKAKDDYKSVLQCGRSMIEMLGVLAIIAVLSVGGIAGYSKAMERYKFIKLRDAWTEVFYNFIQIKNDLNNQEIGGWATETNYVYTMKSLNMLPSEFKYVRGNAFKDSYGFGVTVYSSGNKGSRAFGFFYWLGFDSASPKVCQAFMEAALNFKDNVRKIWREPLAGDIKMYSVWGNRYCSKGLRCMNDMNFNDMNELCSAYKGKDPSKYRYAVQVGF